MQSYCLGEVSTYRVHTYVVHRIYRHLPPSNLGQKQVERGEIRSQHTSNLLLLYTVCMYFASTYYVAEPQEELKIWAHCLYRILDSKKTSRFQFSVPGLREIQWNLKQQKNFNSRDGFFRKSPFCTFSCMNPGFGGPWDML